MNRARVVWGGRRSSGRRGRTDISCWDRGKLKWMLMSRPRYVMEYFKACQVECLVQLDIYREICEEDAEAARRIEIVAAVFGIPIRLISAKPDDSLLPDDILGEDKGEV